MIEFMKKCVIHLYILIFQEEYKENILNPYHRIYFEIIFSYFKMVPSTCTTAPGMPSPSGKEGEVDRT